MLKLILDKQDDDPAFIGRKFNRFVVVAYKGRNSKSIKLYKCKCDCGNIIVTRKDRLLEGTCTSCGCLRNENVSKAIRKHGNSNTRLYKIWKGIRNRCNNPNHPKYERYGGRGIKYDISWNDFSNFYNWAINNGYNNCLTIDRIDNNGNYTPDNCRWVTLLEQERNKSTNLYIKYGNRIYNINELAIKLKLNKELLRKDYHNNNNLDYRNMSKATYNDYLNQIKNDTI